MPFAQLNSVDIPQIFTLGSDFPFFQMLSFTNRKCYSCIFNSGTKSFFNFGLGVVDKKVFLLLPAIGTRQYGM
jgi:hypothetical protein